MGDESEEYGSESVLNESTDADKTELLIEAVRNRQMLYQDTSKDYKNSAKKELKWMEISKEVDESVNWCKAKWRYLRDNYNKKKKMLKGKSGDAAKRIKRWAYFEVLTFLNASLEEAETTGNMPPPDDSENCDDLAGSDQESIAEAKSDPKQPVTQNQPLKRSRKDESQLDQALLRYIDQQSVNQHSEMKDANYYFGMNIAEQLRSFPANAASFAKARISQIMYEIELNVFNPILIPHSTLTDIKNEEVKSNDE